MTRVLPSRRCVKAAFVLVAMGLLVPLAPVVVVFWRIGLALFVLLVVEDFLLRPRPGLVTVRRQPSGLDHVGRSGSYDLTLANLAPRSLRVAFHDRLPVALDGGGARGELLLAPGEACTEHVDFVGLERGEHALLPVGVRVSHRLGLLEYQERVEDGAMVVVAPGRPAGETAWLLARSNTLEESGKQRVRRRGNAWEFESMRDYVVGDDLRRIDWMASARRHRPMVRELRSERNAEVVLALDCGRLMGTLIDGVSKLDLVMTPLLDLAAVSLQRGERVGLIAFDSRPRVWLPPRAGIRQLNALIEGLARLDAGDAPTSYLRALTHIAAHHKKRALVMMFSDFTDEVSAQEIYASLAALARKHVLLFAGVSDPQLDELFGHSPDTTSGIFEKAVAGQLLSERRRTLARIERLGIPTLDAEPARLSGPLIRKYLELRLSRVL